MRVPMDAAESRRVIRWVIGSAVFGAGSAFLADICLLALPAIPGAAVGSLLAGKGILTDHGADLKWLVPVNTAIYALAGYGLGVYRVRAKRMACNEPRCENCSYLLVGNRSGRCPECGTRVSRRCKKMLAVMGSRDGAEPSGGPGRGQDRRLALSEGRGAAVRHRRGLISPMARDGSSTWSSVSFFDDR